MRIISTIILLAAIQISSANEATLDLVKQAKLQTHLDRGLIVNLGSTDGKLETQLAENTNCIVMAFSSDPEISTKLRQQLSTKSLLGKVSIVDWLDHQRVPLTDEAALVLFVDADHQKDLPSEKELLRVVRPDGLLVLNRDGKQQVTTKAWTKGYDEWTHHLHDASGTEVSQDTHLGPNLALHWIASDKHALTEMGVRLCDGVYVSAETLPRKKGNYLVARDAFTGLRLWQRPDLDVRNRYAFVAKDGRVFVYPEKSAHQVSLDLYTGKTLMVYKQGVDLSNEQLQKEMERHGRVPWWQSIVHDDKLIQLASHGLAGGEKAERRGRTVPGVQSRLAVLDVATGKLLWKVDFEKGMMAYLPIVVKDKLALVIGDRKFEGYSYLGGWSSFRLQKIQTYDLKTGKPGWTYNESESWVFVQTMAYREGAIALLAIRRDNDDLRKRSGFFELICLEPETGKTRWRKVSRNKSAHGHGSHDRGIILDGRVWDTNGGRMIGFRLSDGKEEVSLKDGVRWCNVVRGCSTHLMSGPGMIDVRTGKYLPTHAFRPSCDVGSYFAYGRTYTPMTECGCTPFLNGILASSDRLEEKPWNGQRLIQGKATPAETVREKNGWGQYMGNASRALWSDSTISEKAEAIWQQALIKESERSEMQTLDIEFTPWRSGPITAPTVAEGVIAVGLCDVGGIVILDAETGKEKWRTYVDGRVDSPPTIHDGVILTGTRNGWVYAHNRETGGLIWKFFAAPIQRQIMAHGFPESAWPVRGSITIVDDQAWFVSGRHAQIEGGLYWYALKVNDGQLMHKGHIAANEDWKEQVKNPPKEQIYARGDVLCWDEKSKLLMLWDTAIDPKTGKATGEIIPNWGAAAQKEERFRPGTLGLVHSGRYKLGLFGVAHTYAGLRAKLISHDPESKDFIGLLHNNGSGGRGGSDKYTLSRFTFVGKSVDRKTTLLGKEVWDQKVFKRTRGDWDKFQLLAKGGSRFLVSHEKTLHVLSFENGNLMSKLQLPALPVYAGIALYKDKAYVTCRDGRLVCVE